MSPAPTQPPSAGLAQRLGKEVAALATATGYFLIWLAWLMCLKILILEEYHITVHKFSMVFLGALVLSKVVLVLEHVPLTGWLNRAPALVEVLARTLLYSFGVLMVLLLEKALESRHEAGGFGAALRQIFQHRDMPHVWANVLCLGGALLTYNLLALVRHRLGPRGLYRLLLKRPNGRNIVPEDDPGARLD